MPENLEAVEPALETAAEPIINEPEQAVIVDPPLAPAPEPEKAPEPIAELAKPRIAIPGTCPECGKGGFEGEKGLEAHIRFKHTLPRQRKEAAAAKAKAGEPIPADFSDITGQPPPQSTPIAVLPDQRFEGMANMSFDMTTGLLARIFGPEWLPQPDADNPQVSHERLTVVASIKKYYESVNLPDIPPGYMLCFVALAYAAPRMTAQPTKTKLQAAWLWLKLKFQRRKSVGIPTIVK
jgi:hypothetical protein